MTRFVFAVALLIGLLGVLHAAEGPSRESKPAPQLVFKEAVPQVSLPILVAVTLGMIVTAVGLILLVGKYSSGLSSLRLGGARRLRLVEAVRIAPKTAVFLIECDETSYLLAQSGDQLLVLSKKISAESEPRATDEG